MKEFLREDIASHFGAGPVAIAEGSFVTTPIVDASLSRTDDLDLLLTLTSRAHRTENRARFSPGTVRRADDEIEFDHAAGWRSIARGVIERDWQSCSNAAGEPQTLETYSAHSVEIDFQTQVRPSYTIEWVLNVPDRSIWSEPVRFSGVETLTKTIGAGDAQIRIERRSESFASAQALHLRLLGTDLYLIRSTETGDEKRKPGQIVYRGCPDQAARDKVRTCLSFVLGKLIVYLGHTEYSNDWRPTTMRAVDGHAIDGAVFRLPDQPPYPIGQAHSNVIDQNQVQAAVSALVDRSETIKFDELSWAYWYAKCAPLHAAAAHFGSLIEQLQTNSSGLITVRKSLLEHDAWNGLKGIIHQWLRTMQLDLDVRRIIEGKASGLNHAPAGVVLRRMFEGMGFAMSDLEANAWRHRNSAAHGGFSADPEATIRNSKVLWLLFHRMLAGVTHCSDMYVDYFSLKHPVRLIGEAVPRG